MSTGVEDTEDPETPKLCIVKRINKQEDNSALPKGEGLEQEASRPATVPVRRKLGPLQQLTKENILEQYKENLKGLELSQDITPVQMPIHKVPVVKRDKEKAALDPI